MIDDPDHAPRIRDLCRFLAGALREPDRVIEAYVTALRAAGELPKDAGGRGRVGGAVVEPRHAAVILVALCGTAMPAGAAKAVESIGGYQLRGVMLATAELASPLFLPACPADDVTPVSVIADEITSTAPRTGRLTCIGHSRSRATPTFYVDSLGYEPEPFRRRAIFTPRDAALPPPLDLRPPIEDSRSIAGSVIEALAEFFSDWAVRRQNLEIAFADMAADAGAWGTA